MDPIHIYVWYSYISWEHLTKHKAKFGFWGPMRGKATIYVVVGGSEDK